jgi:archaellum biogenesis ATPase FlaH
MKVIAIAEVAGERAIEGTQKNNDGKPYMRSGPLPTGIDILDRNINGGLPVGSLVYFSADPRSMPEVFLYELLTPRKTYYITTHTSPSYIRRNMSELNFKCDSVEFLDLHEEYYNRILPATSDRRIAVKKLMIYITGWLDVLKKKDDKSFTIIFDSFSFLVELGIDIDTLKRLLDEIYDIISEKEGICYLMMIKGMHNESVENYIQYWCDVIFDIDIERKGDKIVNKLALPKIRGMTPVTDYIKFKVTDRITIDTSKDIA